MANVTTARVGDDVYVSFTVPVANVDGHQPADIEKVELYAVTATHPPENEEQRKVATLVATLPVQPIMPELPPQKDGTPAPPLPVPPGVVRGAVAVFKERLTDQARVAVELPTRLAAAPVKASDTDAEEGEPFSGPLVAPTPAQLPRRYYFLVGVSPRGRSGAASTPVPVGIEPEGGAPGAPKVTFTETDLVVAWAPSPDAKTSTIVPIVPVAPVVPSPVAGVATNATPAVPVVPVAPVPAVPPIVAKSLGFNTIATTYHVYEVPPTPAPEDPLTLTVPKPLTAQPTPGTELAIKGVSFGTERCFEVRAVETVGGVAVQGPASPRTCLTPTRHLPARGAEIPGGHRGRGCHQLDLGSQRRGRPRGLPRLARRSAG